MERHRRQITSNVNCPSTWGRGRAVRLPDPNLYASDVPIHFTIGANNGAPFNDAMIAAMVCNSVQKSCELLHFRLFIYCLMPDHLHVVISPAESRTPASEFLRKLKSFTTRQYQLRAGESHLWQNSAFDRVIRPHEDIQAIVRYIAANPVRRELVKCWTDWPWTKVFIDL